MKNILLIGWYFYPSLGGAETLMLEQAKYFVKQGYTVSVLTSNANNLLSEESFKGINIYRRKYIDSALDKTSLIKKELPDILNKIKPDIVHFHNGSYPCAAIDKTNGADNIISMVEIIQKHDIKVVEHAHNAQLNQPLQTEKLRNLNWDHIIFVSGFVKEKWEKLGFKSKAYSVVHNGINVEKFEKVKPDKSILKIKGEKTLIFFPSRVISMILGEMSKQKNFLLLLKAANELRERKVEDFVIVALINKALNKNSNIKGIKEVEYNLEKYNLKGKVKFFDSILPEKMPSFFSASDIICVPSIDETFGLVYLEAMASGKVAIASNTGGPKEYIENNKTGFLVNPQDYLKLADILEDLINNPSKIREIGKRAQIESKKYTTEIAMEKIKKIYEEIL